MSTPNETAADNLAKAVHAFFESGGEMSATERMMDAIKVYDEEAAKQITYVGMSPPSERDGDKFQIENLVVLVMRLCALLPPDKQARVAALDYLQRHKLTPSPLREQIDAAKAVPACEWCNGAGVLRSLGRDNDDIIEDCPNCQAQNDEGFQAWWDDWDRKGMQTNNAELMARDAWRHSRKSVPAKQAEDEGRIYPCDNCGTMRTKAEGGTCFTLCEECWEKEFGSAKSKNN